MKIIALLSMVFLLSACGEGTDSEVSTVLGKWQNGSASIEINPVYVTISDNGQGFKYETSEFVPTLVFASQNGRFNFSCDYSVSSHEMRTFNCLLNGRSKQQHGPMSGEAKTLNAIERSWNKVN